MVRIKRYVGVEVGNIPRSEKKVVSTSVIANRADLYGRGEVNYGRKKTSVKGRERKTRVGLLNTLTSWD